jgi:serine/threonine protein kinase
MDLTGKHLGHYQVKDELGRGGTAVVYRATDLRRGEDVALKILTPAIASDEMFLKRFVKEGKHATRLQHKNIVSAYEAGEIDGIYYIAMELITGGTLAEYSLKQRQLLSVDETINILSQIAAALDYAHSEGFLHRDVKPSNVLLIEDGRVLLADFGTAKQITVENTMMTAVGQRIGTPSFMAPEQISGELEVDYRVDVYSLGVLAYKLFTGRLPFAASSQAELLHKIVYEMPLSPETLNPDLPAHVVHNLKRALSKDPAQRYESAGQFVAAMVAGQIWATKITANHAAATARASRFAIKHQRRTKKTWQGAAKPLLIACLLTLLLSPSFDMRNVSPALVLNRTIAELDRLSSTLTIYLQAPQAQVIWQKYGEPIFGNDPVNANASQSAEPTDPVAEKSPNSWLQQTRQWWNKARVRDLLVWLP